MASLDSMWFLLPKRFSWISMVIFVPFNRTEAQMTSAYRLLKSSSSFSQSILLFFVPKAECFSSRKDRIVSSVMEELPLMSISQIKVVRYKRNAMHPAIPRKNIFRFRYLYKKKGKPTRFKMVRWVFVFFSRGFNLRKPLILI